PGPPGSVHRPPLPGGPAAVRDRRLARHRRANRACPPASRADSARDPARRGHRRGGNVTLDERARTTARATRQRFAAVAAPDAGAVVRRAQHRRRLAVAAGAAALIVAAAVPLSLRAGTGTEVESGRPGIALPAGSSSVAGWSRIPKQSAGLPANASFSALSSNGHTILIAGEHGIWR